MIALNTLERKMPRLNNPATPVFHQLLVPSPSNPFREQSTPFAIGAPKFARKRCEVNVKVNVQAP
jgi:hypothetical protein